MKRVRTKHEELYEDMKDKLLREIRAYRRKPDAKTQRFIVDMLHALGDWVEDRNYHRIKQDYARFLDKAWRKLFDLEDDRLPN
ncbi:MAG: hypothetical protein AAB408_03110 [Patescibacteria group bacterium]